MTRDQRSPNDFLARRRFSGKRVVLWMFLFILVFGALFWLGMVFFILPLRG